MADLASALKTTPYYIMGWDNVPVLSTADGIGVRHDYKETADISTQEAKVVDKFRKLNDKGKDYIMHQLDFASTILEYTNK